MTDPERRSAGPADGARGYLTATAPPLARLLLLLFAHPRQREFIVGDLDEEFAARVRGGGATGGATGGARRAARRWYRRMAARSLVAGWTAPPGEPAERSPETEEIRRREDVMELVWMDLRQALRALRRRPLFSVAVVATLALAVGANTAMFSVVHAVLLRPLPYHEPDGLVRAYQSSTDAIGSRSSFSWLNLEDYRRDSRAFESLASWRESEATMTGLDRAELVSGAQVSRDFFRVFRAAPVIGRPIRREDTEHDAPLAVVLSEDFWRARFGQDAEILGHRLELDGDAYEIVGVAPAGFAFPPGAAYWVGERLDPEGCGQVRGCRVLNVIGRLAPGATLRTAREEAAGIATGLREAYPDANVKLAFHLVSLEELTVGPVRAGLLVLLGAVAMVLLIACVNISNLLYANWLRRQGEVAVRSAIGASRRRIVQMMLTESSLLAVLGGVIGVLVAVWTLGGFRLLAGGSIPRIEEVGLAWPVLLFTMVVVADAVLIFGLAPALALSRRPLSELIKGFGPRHTRRGAGGARAALLATQVALSLVLLLGTGLLLRTLGQLRAVQLGFDPDGVQAFTLSMPSVRYAEPEDNIRFYAELIGRIEGLPGVTGAAAVFGSPLSGVAMGGSILLRDRPDPPREDIPSTLIRQVTPGYFDLLGIPVLRGRTFSTADGARDPWVIVVSETTARRLWPGEDPIGKPVRLTAYSGFPEQERRVVGVVGDVRSGSVRRAADLEVYVAHAQSGSDFLTVLVRGEDGVPPAIPPLEAVVHRLEPDVALIEPGPMRTGIEGELATPRFYAVLLAAFAGLALLLTAIGLYGVVAFQVSSRFREIGIRMAVGAHGGNVVRLMTRQGLVPSLLGIGAGLLGATALTRLVAGLLYNVRPHDPATWLGVTAALVVVAAAASTVPALRATRIAPADVLRVE